MKAKFIKPGFSANLVDYSAVKFPVKVQGKKFKNRLGKVCGMWVTQEEIRRIGGVIKSQEDVGDNSFLFSFALGEIE